MPFVGARDLVRAVVVVPGTKAKETSGRKRLIPLLRIQQITGDLRLYELIVRHVIV